MGAIILIIVIVLVAGISLGTLGALGGTTSSSSTSCSPASSPVCKTSATHDVSLTVPLATGQAGTEIPMTATLPSGETSSSWTFNYGDGSTLVAPTGSVSHIYNNPGVYLITVGAKVGTALHDNLNSVGVVSISASAYSPSSSNAPGTVGVITATSSGSPYAILTAGGTASFSANYVGTPENPLFTANSPTFVGSTGATITTSANTTSSATASFSFATVGIYTVTYVASASSAASGTAYDNFTWTVDVSTTLAHVNAPPTATSPHKGILSVYEFIPGGGLSEDPAIDYETAGYEPILNVYQTLVLYNNSRTSATTGSFVPNLATCVPGSAECTTQYGSSLYTGENWTFVINTHSRFYDPATGNSWPVYPTDVLFSIARTLSFSTQPAWTSNNGWILAQSLLPSGNKNWDGAVHYPVNNTPQNIFAHILVNNTASGNCPTPIPANGCVTFVADGQGHDWPVFLQLVVDGLGGSIVPCGWFSASPQDAGIPYWTYGNISGSGDHPCLLPGDSSPNPSSSDASFQTFVAGIPSIGWDNYQGIGSGTTVPGSYWGNVQFAMAGSGPYYMYNYKPGTSYELMANPAYQANPGCYGSTACQPQANTPGNSHYVGTVQVLWETTPEPGEAAYVAGTADFAGIPTTQTSLLLQLIQQGKAQATAYPTLSIGFYPFTWAYDVSLAQEYTPTPITAPSTFFSNEAMRGLFATAFPYTTVQQTINEVDGIEFAFTYGGAIPIGMNYAPTNVSWPTTNPSTTPTYSTVGSAWWWWHEATTPGTPYYNGTLAAACTSSHPCVLPLIGENGDPEGDVADNYWISWITTITNGTIKPILVDINFVDLVINSLYSAPYENPMPIYTLAWAPDYSDPTDYMAPLYLPNGTYTYSDTLEQQVSLYNTTCSSSSYPTWSNYAGWSAYATTNGGAIPQSCQGTAYAALVLAAHLAAAAPAGAARALLYAEVSQIANGLKLYTYNGQGVAVPSFAPWISASSINTNVCIGGGGDNLWYNVQGNGIY